MSVSCDARSHATDVNSESIYYPRHELSDGFERVKASKQLEMLQGCLEALSRNACLSESANLR